MSESVWNWLALAVWIICGIAAFGWALAFIKHCNQICAKKLSVTDRFVLGLMFLMGLAGLGMVLLSCEVGKHGFGLSLPRSLKTPKGWMWGALLAAMSCLVWAFTYEVYSPTPPLYVLIPGFLLCVIAVCFGVMENKWPRWMRSMFVWSRVTGVLAILAMIAGVGMDLRDKETNPIPFVMVAVLFAVSVFLDYRWKKGARNGSRQGSQNPHGGTGGVAPTSPPGFPSATHGGTLIGTYTFPPGTVLASGQSVHWSPGLGRFVGYQNNVLADPPLESPQPKVEHALVAGPVIAYRGWQSTGTTIHGIGNGQSVYWKPGVPLRASCLEAGSEHTSPLRGCSCGVYAIKDRNKLGAFICDVFGKVALWGKVIEHEHGYRAEYAYPLAFFVPKPPMPGFPMDTSIVELAKRYGIDVEVLE